MRKILVTGGAGFIGANFVHYWMSKYKEDKIIVLDALTYAGNLSNLESVRENPSFSFIHGNILNTELVETLLRQHRIDTLIHFAAESHVDRSISEPDTFLETNIMGTHCLLKAVKKVWLDESLLQGNEHRFHHVSTDEVYGTLSPEAPAFTETTPYSPNSPYAASKAASDHLVRAYKETYGLNATISNCSNNYGPYHFPEKLIPLLIINILQNKALPVYGDGLQVRDWLFVEDHARGIELALNNGKAGECYNIGGHNEWRNIDIVRLVCQLMNDAFSGKFEQLAVESFKGLTVATLKQRFPQAMAAITGNTESLIEYIQDRPGHDRRYAINAEKAGKQLGYYPQTTFEMGIRQTIHWYLTHEYWWKPLIHQ